MRIQTEIEINASAKTVWDVLTDFSAYPEWNPFIIDVSGEVAVGNQISIKLTPPDSNEMNFKPVVQIMEPTSDFMWIGRLFFKGVFDGAHRFQIKEIAPTRVQFVHSEEFSGILVPILKKMVEGSTTQGFIQMNEAIKLRAESIENKA
ncbi:MAG TPA: SRPBCC domain-containing protein [Flavobacteriales bacterium]|jgi:hypothetical protein|nr:SRPBCC domain-containing protein [Flavobacteriales bacterium]HAW19797.1 SRPBCC domain-containing protein [Flavobacteriales bacterium]